MTGIDFEFIANHLPHYGKALLLTLALGIGGIAGSMIVGLPGALLLHFRVPVLRNAVAAYVGFSRNTPLLAQLFFLYFGLPAIGIRWSGFTCALVGLTFLGGGYMIEALRSGIESVGRPQIESALSLGFSRAQITRRIVLPQALASATPALAANCIFLLKETSVVGIIAVADLMHLTQDLIGLYYKTTESLILLVTAYVIVIVPVSWLFSRLEKVIRHAEFG
ncbi:MAG: amino acid ABC transporter permease [Opitutaceae bacterium]|jgi:polar amino acid transport system permease protein|nr:amino acid ABC transporter permease [Opitutaceae bacterium]